MKARNIVILVILTTIVCSLFLLFWFSPKISKASFDRIQAGMSEREVYQLVGCPNEQEQAIRNCWWFSDKPEDKDKSILVLRKTWHGSNISFIVEFDSSGFVVYKDYQSKENEGFLLKFLRTLF